MATTTSAASSAQEGRFIPNCRSSRARGASSSGSFGRNGSRENERGRVITGETWVERQEKDIWRALIFWELFTYLGITSATVGHSMLDKSIIISGTLREVTYLSMTTAGV